VEGSRRSGKRAKTFYKSLTQIASIIWNKGPVVLGKMSQTQIGIPKFTSKEMADLIAYLYFLHFIDEPETQSMAGGFLRIGCANVMVWMENQENRWRLVFRSTRRLAAHGDCCRDLEP